jgi:hypothetical protein
LPTILLDDLDSSSLPVQEEILALSMRLADRATSLVIVSAEDTTLWRLRSAHSLQLDPFNRRVDDRFWLLP